jgi:hypothetical protein
MSTDATIFVWKLTKKQVTPTEKLILLSYADRADEHGRAYPSIKRLIEDTLLDRKTIIKALATISSKGIMVKTGELQGRTKQVPVYKFPTTTFREQLQTNSPNIGTGTNNGTSPKNGTPTSPNIGTGTSPNIGTRNLKEESTIESKKKNNKKKVDLSFSIEEALQDNPHQIERELIEEWVSIRTKKHKADFTKRVWERHNRITSQLTSKGVPIFEIMDRLITKEWQAIEESYYKDLFHSQTKLVHIPPKTNANYDDSDKNWKNLEAL